jgi:PAS domain-containing protein
VVQFHGDGPWTINYVNPSDDPGWHTLHNKMRDALNETGERYRSLFDSSLDAIFFLGADERFEAANPAAVRRLFVFSLAYLAGIFAMLLADRLAAALGWVA